VLLIAKVSDATCPELVFGISTRRQELVVRARRPCSISRWPTESSAPFMLAAWQLTGDADRQLCRRLGDDQTRLRMNSGAASNLLEDNHRDADGDDSDPQRRGADTSDQHRSRHNHQSGRNPEDEPHPILPSPIEMIELPRQAS
jgi:hypothetical protein